VTLEAFRGLPVGDATEAGAAEESCGAVLTLAAFRGLLLEDALPVGDDSLVSLVPPMYTFAVRFALWSVDSTQSTTRS
jgi:hypothetical protein